MIGDLPYMIKDHWPLKALSMHLSLGYPLGLQSSMVFNHDHHDHRDCAELEQCTVLGHTFLSEFGFKSHKQQSSSDLLDGGLCHRGQFSDQTHAPLELHKEAQRYQCWFTYNRRNAGTITRCRDTEHWPDRSLSPSHGDVPWQWSQRGSLRQRSMQKRSYPTFTSNEATREPPSRYTGVRGAHLLEGTGSDQWGVLGTAQGAAAIVDVNSIRGLVQEIASVQTLLRRLWRNSGFWPSQQGLRRDTDLLIKF